MFYYIISFLLSAGISISVYLVSSTRLIKRDPIRPNANGRRWSYIKLFSVMLGSLFITLFGGTALCFFIQNILFIKPGGGYPLRLDSSEMMIIIPMAVVAILVMVTAVSTLPEIRIKSIKRAKKSTHIVKQIAAICLFICLVITALGIHNYAYVINNRITVSTSLSFNPAIYNTSDIYKLAVTTNYSRGEDYYSFTIFFSDGTSIKADLYDLGYMMEYIPAVDITFDTAEAQAAFNKEYGRHFE